MSVALASHLKYFRTRLAAIEQELHLAHQAQEVVQAFAEPLFVFDTERRVRYANEAARSWLRATGEAVPGTLQGRMAGDLFPDKLARALEAHAPSAAGELVCFKLPEPDHARVLAARVHRGADVLVVELGYEPLPEPAQPSVGTPADEEPALEASLQKLIREARGPLGDILGLAALLHRSTLDERQRACIEQLQTAAHELQEMLGGERQTAPPTPFEGADVHEELLPAGVPPVPHTPPPASSDLASEPPRAEADVPTAVVVEVDVPAPETAEQNALEEHQEGAPPVADVKGYITEQLVRAEPMASRPGGDGGESPTVFGAEGDEALHGLHVLIVDGDSTHCWLLRDQAAAWGMVPHPFIGAEEAVNWLLRNNTCDLAIVDEDLPDVAGHELARRLKSHQPGLPVILVSTHRQLEEADAPFEVWLTKPYRQRLLLDTMCELVQSVAAENPESLPGKRAPADPVDEPAPEKGSPWAGLDPDDPALAFVDEVLRACRKSVGELLSHIAGNTGEPLSAVVQALHTNCQLLDLPRLLTWSAQVHAAHADDPSAMHEPLNALLDELNALIRLLDEHVNEQALAMAENPT